MKSNDPNWLATYRGESPRVAWQHQLNVSLTALAFARESGQLFVADTGGGIYEIDPTGEISKVSRLSTPLRKLVWSDDGSQGFGLSGEDQLHWIKPDLTIRASVQLPDTALCVAAESYGEYAAVALSNGTTLLMDGPRQPLRHFTSTRPLTHLRFLTTVPGLVGIADYGMVCRFDFKGTLLWQKNTFSSVGGFCTSGDGQFIVVAGFTQGILRFDGEGDSVGSYQLGGTVNRVAASFTGTRLIAATQEMELQWLGTNGQILWTGNIKESPLFLQCDSWGGSFICGFESGLVARLAFKNPAKEGD